MTPSRFELTLLSGRMHIKRADSATLSESVYDTAQAAAEKAFDHIAHDTGITQGGDPDESKMVEAFGAGAIRLEIAGHPREIAVAALHFHVRYGIDWPGAFHAEEAGVHLNPIHDAEDAYATFRFESDSRPLEVMRGMLDRWMKLAEREPRVLTRAQEEYPRWREILGLEGEAQPLRVVVTGVTGAGKSTFINGLLSRDIVPHSSEVCTAAVLHLRHPPEREGEHLRIHWRSAEDLSKQAEDLEREKEYLESMLRNESSKNAIRGGVSKLKAGAQRIADRHGAPGNGNHREISPQGIEHDLSECTQRLASLRASQPLWELEKPTRAELSALPKFAKNSADSYAEATAFIEVFVQCALLKRLEIVDAPGLRDGSDARQKTLLGAFEGDTAWLYLVPADVRTEDCKADWAFIQSCSKNGSGILVLTKTDNQPPDPGTTRMETIQDRLKKYSKELGWSRPATWCSAYLTVKSSGIDDRQIEENLESGSFTLLQDLLEYPKRKCLRRFEDYILRDALGNEISISRDYIFDSSRLPCVVRAIGSVLLQDTLKGKEIHGRDSIEFAVKEALQLCCESIAISNRMIESHDVVLEKKRQLAEIQESISWESKDLGRINKQAASMRNEIRNKINEIKCSLAAKVESLRSEFYDHFSSSFDRQVSWQLFGKVKYGLQDFFGSSLNEAARNKAENFSQELCTDLQSLTNVPLQLNIGHNWRFDGFFVTVEDREQFLERSKKAKNRMWKTVKSKAERCAESLETYFSEHLDCIRESAEKTLHNAIHAVEKRIEQRAAQEKQIEHEIKNSTPEQSRRMAEETLSAFQQHKEAFERFLAELGSSGPKW
jgi:hypothetical protein